MTQTITISDQIAVNSRGRSRYSHIYAEIERALAEGREITFSDFADFRSAWKTYISIGYHYRDAAYICFRKYGHNGAISPAITVCGRCV